MPNEKTLLQPWGAMIGLMLAVAGICFLGGCVTPPPAGESGGSGKNLARQGAYLLASSFDGTLTRTTTSNFYYDNLFDGRLDTVWRPKEDEVPHWVETRWRYPLRINRVELRGSGVDLIEKMECCAWAQDDWHPIKCAGGRHGETWTATFREVNTSRFLVRLFTPAGRRPELAEIGLFGPEQPLPPSTLPYKQAKTAVPAGIVFVDKLKITPKEATPGSRIKVEFEASLPKPSDKDFYFLLDLSEPAREWASRWGDYDVAGIIVSPDRPMSSWTPGEKHSFKTEICLPAFAPAGKIPLQIHAVSRDGNDYLAIKDAAGTEKEIFANVDIQRSPMAQVPAARIPAALVFDHGSSAFMTGGKPCPPFFWESSGKCDFEQAYHYSQSGIEIFCCALYSSRLDPDKNNWKKDFDVLDQRIANVLRASPDAVFLVLIDLRPNAKWLSANKSELFVNVFGQTPTYYKGHAGTVCYASKKYEQDCMAYLHALFAFLKDKPYYNRIIGYHPWSCGQLDSVLGGIIGTNYGQADRSKINIGDYNLQAVNAFRDWLNKKYGGSLESLRKAWKDEAVTFDTAKPEIRQLVHEGAAGGMFRDPVAEGAAPFDYLEFLPTLLGGFYSRLAACIKRETDGQALVGIHYGFTLAHLRAAPPGVKQHNNNFDLPERLRDPNIDFYISAPAYEFRHAGQPYVSYFPSASLHLHGRMYVADDDLRTFIAGTLDDGRNVSWRETRAMAMRNLFTNMLRQEGARIGDFSGDHASKWSGEHQGWFIHPTIIDTYAFVNRIFTEAMKQERRPATEIAVFVSCSSPRYEDVYRQAAVYHNLIDRMMYEDINLVGAPYDLYLMDDLGHEKIRQDYKLYVFVNPFFMSEKERAEVARLKKNGKTLLWLYAPGYVDAEKGLSTTALSGLIGMEVALKANAEHMRLTFRNSQYPISRALPEGMELATEGYDDDANNPNSWCRLHPIVMGPVFYVNDSKADSLGFYPDGKAAFAARDFGDWKSVYCAIPYLNSRVLRAVARYAGVHVYCNEDVVLQADSRYLMIHNGYAKECDLEIALPARRRVTDAWSGEVITDGSNRFNLHMPKCHTCLLILQEPL